MREIKLGQKDLKKMSFRKRVDDILDRFFYPKELAEKSACVERILQAIREELVPEEEKDSHSGKIMFGAVSGWNSCRNEILERIEKL